MQLSAPLLSACALVAVLSLATALFILAHLLCSFLDILCCRYAVRRLRYVNNTPATLLSTDPNCITEAPLRPGSAGLRTA